MRLCFGKLLLAIMRINTSFENWRNLLAPWILLKSVSVNKFGDRNSRKAWKNCTLRNLFSMFVSLHVLQADLQKLVPKTVPKSGVTFKIIGLG